MTVHHARGCEVTGTDRSGIPPAVAATRAVDVAVVVLGERPTSFTRPGGTDGEAMDAADLELTGVQEELLRAVHATGTPVVLVLLNGRALAVNWAAAHVPAIVEAFLPGEFGGRAVAEILYGHVNPSGRLPVTVPEASANSRSPTTRSACARRRATTSASAPPPLRVRPRPELHHLLLRPAPAHPHPHARRPEHGGAGGHHQHR